MTEPRTWTLEGALWGYPIVRGGPQLAPGEHKRVVEKAPVDTERERMLDLLERVKDSFEIVRQGLHVTLKTDIEALLIEHDRLPKEATDE